MDADKDSDYLKREIRRFQNSIELIANPHRPDRRTRAQKWDDWFGQCRKAFFSPQFLIGTLGIIALTSLIGYFKDNWDKRQEAEKNKRQRIEAKVEKVNSIRAEIEDIIGQLSRENAQFLAIVFFTELIGNEIDINQGYLAFNFRSANDLKMQRVINLRNEAEEWVKELDKDSSDWRRLLKVSDSEQINENLMLGLILAQNANVESAEIYLGKCLSTVDTRLENLKKDLRANDPEIVDQAVAETEILKHIALQAETIQGVLRTVNLYNDPNAMNGKSSSQLEALLNEAFAPAINRFQLEEHTIRARFMQAIVLAVQSLLAESIASHNDRFQPAADNISDRFLLACETFELLPTSEYLNYIDFIRKFVFLSASKVLLKRARINIKLERLKAANENLGKLEEWSKYFDVTENAQIEFDVLNIKLLNKQNTKANTAKRWEYRRRIKEHYFKSNTSSQMHKDLRRLLLASTVMEIKRIINELNNSPSDDPSAKRRLDLLFQDLELLDAIWVPGVDLAQLMQEADKVRD